MTRLLFTLLLITSCLACKSDQASEAKEVEKAIEEKLPKDFVNFYGRFLSDSLFQVDHVLFPLEGIPDNAQAEDADGQFRWQLEDWKMHRPIPAGLTEFSTEFNIVGPGIILERIVHETGQYAMLRRFAKLGGEWTLIYYAGLNSIVTEEG